MIPILLMSLGIDFLFEQDNTSERRYDWLLLFLTNDELKLNKIV